ncbi:hypothetical protein STRDD11_02632 [Streptococcus sp. DD11]|uniref:hypothetical protein n=1 Tax=Streptococcus sp. DD11 TaxID=1777879 RepID=UPI000791809B|nr:hypothetical protein [Streptococcus sp. DD11]KXT77448.1 hypothetical protein STRDD11_02632 [Streptococcus sp. DD11]
MKKEEKTSEILNKEYFQALGSTRASVGMLKLAWPGLFVLSIGLAHVYYFVENQLHQNPFSNAAFLFLLAYDVFFLFCQIVSFSPKLIFRHQAFSTALLFAMINGLLLSLVLMGFVIIILANNVLKNSFIYTIIYWSSAFIFFLGLIFYNLRWLKKQLENGFSEERTNANYFAASSVFSKTSLWIIFALTILGVVAAAILTRSWNSILGVSGNVLFISAFSRLIVEVGYLLYLRIKDKSYWEEVPEELTEQSLLKVLDVRKAKSRLIIEVVLFFSLMSYIRAMDIDVANSPIWLTWTVRIFGYTIGLDAITSLVLHQIKKRKRGK